MKLELRRREMTGGPSDIIIDTRKGTNEQRANAKELMKIIFAQGWCNSPRYMLKREAELVTDIGTVFSYNKSITDFSAFRYFTSVKEVMSSAFEDCFNLKYIELPNSVEKFGNKVFSRNLSLMSPLILPISTKCIGDKFFTQNSRCKEIVLNEGLETIGKECFDGVSGVNRLFIPKTVKSIGRYCLNSTCVVEVDSENPYYDSRESCNAIILTSENKLTSGNSLTKFVEGIEIIGYASMNMCPNSIRMPDTLRIIESQAFQRIRNLKEVYLNEGLTDIGQRAFIGCGIEVFNFPTTLTNCHPKALDETPYYNNLPDGVLYINDWVWKYKNSANEIGIDIIIKRGTSQIGSYAFDGDYSFIKSIDLPNTLTTIGVAALRGCSKVERVIIRSNTLQFIKADTNLNSLNKECVFYVPDDRIEYYAKLLHDFVLKPLSDYDAH